MAVSRRKFLRGILGMGTGGASFVGDLFGSNLPGFVEDKTPHPPNIAGRVFADFHAHPSKHNLLEDILGMLSWGITGLAYRNNAPIILSYKEALGLPGVKEIDKGIMAGLTYKGSTGYFIRAEEVEGNNHILALGCKKAVAQCKDSFEVIEDIHRQGGIAVVNHPFFVPDCRSPFNYRFVEKNEERFLQELCAAADEVESFNAQAICIVPGLMDLRPANVFAERLARYSGHKGMAASDAHYVLEQVKIAGNYFPSEGLCFEAIRHHVKMKKFIPYHQHVSRWSFLAGRCY